MLATGLKTHRKCIQTALSAILLVSTIAWAQAQNSKLHAAGGSTPHVTVDVDEAFTQVMGENAGLSFDHPKLSSDGLHYGTDENNNQVASAECLIDETIVAQKTPSLTPDVIASLCKRFAFSPLGDGKITSVDELLHEHQSGPSIDDALIHIVKWDKGKPDGSWYQYTRHSGKWSGKLISQHEAPLGQVDYLLGKNNVAFFALHLGVDDTCKISYDVNAQHTRPLNQQDFIDLVQLAEAYYQKGGGATTNKTGGGTPAGGATPKIGVAKPAENTPKFASLGPLWGVWGGITVLALPNLPASITITPSTGNAKSLREVTADETRTGDGDWDITTTTCASSGTSSPNPPTAQRHQPADSLSDVNFPSVRSAVFVQPAAADLESSEAGEGATLLSASKKKPSSKTQTQGAPAQTKDTSSGKDPLSSLGVTVPNETLYWWDVSVAMPVTSFNQLTYNSTDNLVELKKTNDIKPYALVDFFPFKADLKAKNYLSLPKLSAGLPLASQPLQKPFVGTGFTIGIGSFRFQPLVGLRIEKDQRTTTLTPGSSADQAQLTNDLRYQWHAKLQVMIGFSVADAKKVLGLK